ncbi:hypothetical protein MLD38_031591 [Melastoma candidum]|uniref:Uncharacterized protein n=1 Tax=Melastoma candidum TaxID=119954 RepID=A0ACB9MPR6_9MYRT|nr:hypothetical protein MLD38_031591 [Melastoma candidum]
MLSLGVFWRRHKRKILVGLGILGGGYCAYKLYDAHRRTLAELEREIADERENDELAKAQLQAHFENIQRIANTTTLPHAINYLNGRIAEELDLSRLTERLMRGKDQPDALTPVEKLELWEQLKVLSFTKLLSSIWGMALLNLYIRVQVNILGRHLYIDAARGLGISQLPDGDSLGVDDQQKFLASADFLSSHGLPALTSYMRETTQEVLRGKHLRDNFDNATLHEVILQVLDKFMSTASRHHWLGYLMPENDRSEVATTSNDDPILPAVATYGRLMSETKAVLLSSEFSNIVEMTLKMVVNAVVEDFTFPGGGSAVPFKMPLAKLLPRVAQMGSQLLEEQSKNRYIQLIGSSPEVELFFTLLYTNTEIS